MATQLDLVPAAPATLTVLPGKQRGTAYLQASGALELAVLGSTVCRMTPLERLLETVDCLTGPGWRPPRDCVLDTLQAATKAGAILATESWVRSIPFFYTLTPTGASTFRQLMALPVPESDHPMGPAIADVKFGLLDHHELCDAVAVAADLRRFYLDYRAEQRRQSASTAVDLPVLNWVREDRRAWADSRLDMLTCLACQE